jgi:hypothetical protein
MEHLGTNIAATQVVINGNIYDLQKFSKCHPGGPTIEIYGGIDATIIYKSKHPSHSTGHLEKAMELYLIGKYTPEDDNNCSAGYYFDSDFAKELKTEVQKVVKNYYADTGYYARSALIMSFWLLSMTWYVCEPSVYAAIVYGVSASLIGMNI